MASPIPERQNEPQSLRRLAAARHFYGRAKQIGAVQFIVAAIIPGAAVVVQRLAPKFDVWVALVGILAALTDEIVFEGFKRVFRERAARMQELFDSHVLGISWSALVSGEKPDREETFEIAIDKIDTTVLRDWYSPSVGALDSGLARLICQRTNCFWDARQRRQYRNALIVVTGLIGVATFFFVTATNLSSRDFIVKLLAPLLPLIMWTVRECREHSVAAGRLDRLKTFTEDLWINAIGRRLTNSQLDGESRRLQDAIYQHRSTSPMVFDWLYRLFRSRLQRQVDDNAAAMVVEATDITLN